MAFHRPQIGALGDKERYHAQNGAVDDEQGEKHRRTLQGEHNLLGDWHRVAQNDLLRTQQSDGSPGGASLAPRLEKRFWHR